LAEMRAVLGRSKWSTSNYTSILLGSVEIAH
jgi:hypothetical protein